jgi:hypothetical protein
MALFTVFEHPSGDPNRTIFVKEGFSFAALIFTVLWALWHRMWVVAAILFVLLTVLNLSAGQWGLDPKLAGLLETAVGIIFGFEARRLWAMSLERAGYRNMGIVEGSNREAAELGYFNGRPRVENSIHSTPRHPLAHDTLGLFGTS